MAGLTVANFHTTVMGGPSIHHYNTPDAVAEAAAADYFNDITDRLRQWDVIHIVAVTGGTHVYNLYIVDSVTGAASVTLQRLDVA